MTRSVPPWSSATSSPRTGFRAKVRLGVALSVVLIFGGAAAANAAVIPGTGPTVGGTSAQLPAVRGLTFTQVSAGVYHTVAVGSDGKTYAWGYNDDGELGDGTTTDQLSPTPVQTPAGVTFTQVAAGAYHTVAVGSDGNAYAWGSNSNGQLGDGTTTDSSVPVRVHAPDGVTLTQVTAGVYHSVAIGSNGNLYAWGSNSSRQLGNDSLTDSSVPVRVDTLDGVNFTHVAAGSFHTIAIGSDGNTYAWGDNTFGELGDGTTTNPAAPVRVQAPTGVTFTQVAAGDYHTVAVGSDGNTYAWGRNAFGELGDGTNTNSAIPVRVQTPAGVTFTQVAAGPSYTVAIGSDGNTYAWGYNSGGQLGNGTTTNSAEPVRVLTPDGVTFSQVAAGSEHAVAIGSDGNTYGWGFNFFGQLGNGSTDDSSIPVPVSFSVASVAFGGVEGTITGQGDGTVTVTTPVHGSGVVDVVLTWSDGFVATIPGGYTFGTAPKITLDPVSGKIQGGETVVLTAAATGDETPTVQWQVSADDGHTWSDVTGAVNTSLSVRAAGHYRAVFHNPLGAATTSAAELTAAVVAPPVSNPTPTPPTASTPPQTTSPTAPPGSGASAHPAGGVLAFTGSNTASMFLGGVLLLLLGGGFITYRTIRSRKQDKNNAATRGV
jgi:alpha-tubulin suppressor-like RCC1 family protein